MEPLCAECPLHSKKNRKQVEPQIPAQPCGLAIIGEQPWTTEASSGRPFVGPSGKLLDGILASLGLGREFVYIDNAIACFAGDWPASATAKAAALEAAWRACRPRLVTALQAAQPQTVLALGGTALQSLLDNPLARVGRLRGSIMTWEETPLTASFHPSAILRGSGQEADVLADDVAKAIRWTFDGGPQPWVEAHHAAPSVATFLGWVYEARSSWKAVTLDLETDGVNRWTAGIRTIGLGDHELALVLPWDEWEQHYSLTEWLAIRAALRELLADPCCSKTFHNKGFDVPLLERHVGLVAGQLDDTMAAHHCLYMKGVRNSLEYVAQRYLDVPAWKVEFEQDYGAPFPELALYNARDVLITARTWNQLSRELDRWQQWPAYEHDLDDWDRAWRMSRRGIPVDLCERDRLLAHYRDERTRAQLAAFEAANVADIQQGFIDEVGQAAVEQYAALKIKDLEGGLLPPDLDRLANLCTRLSCYVLDRDYQKRLADSANKLTELVHDTGWNWSLVHGNGDERQVVSRACAVARTAAKRLLEAVSLTPFVNLNSDVHVGRVIHDWLELPVAAPRTQHGYAVNADALSHVRDHPFVQAFQGFQASYDRVDWLEKLPVYPDGRVHPLYKTHVIPSSRWSCGDARSPDPLEHKNFLNVEPVMLDLFHVDPDHERLVGADFSAAEMTVCAWVTGCKAIYTQLRSAQAGTDIKFHGQTARVMWPEHRAAPLELQREEYCQGDRYLRAKIIGFQFIYGGGAEAMYQMVRPTLAIMADETARFHAEEELRATVRRAHQNLKRGWWEVIESNQRAYYTALETGELRTGYVTGRKLRFPLRDRDHVSPTFVANAIIQTTTREFVSQAAAELERRLPSSAALIIDTHDCLIVRCPKDAAEDVAALMTEVMRFPLDTPHGPLELYAEAKIGSHWREVK